MMDYYEEGSDSNGMKWKRMKESMVRNYGRNKEAELGKEGGGMGGEIKTEDNFLPIFV